MASTDNKKTEQLRGVLGNYSGDMSTVIFAKNGVMYIKIKDIRKKKPRKKKL